MLEVLLSKYLGEILAFITISIISIITSYLYNYRNKIKANTDKYKRIERKLYGFEKDDTDDGFIQRTDRRLSNQRDKLDEIDNEVKNIKHTLDKIDDKLNNGD